MKMFSMLITYKDVILYELTIVVSTMVTEALSIDIRGHTYGKGIPGFLWPLCLLTMHGIIYCGASAPASLLLELYPQWGLPAAHIVQPSVLPCWVPDHGVAPLQLTLKLSLKVEMESDGIRYKTFVLRVTSFGHSW